MYLRNIWYVAGWAHELTSDALLGRTYLDQPVVLFRGEGGTAHALMDRCPHRFAPLSLGVRTGDAVQCPYHGLQFDGSGACVRNPHGPITSAIAVTAYPLVERHRMLWIWLGDATLADPALIPDFGFFDGVPDTAFSGDYLRSGGNYQLYVDNLLDLTHLDYLHPTTLGASGGASKTPARVTQLDDGSIAVLREESGKVPIPLALAALGRDVPLVDSWSRMTWRAPGILTNVAGNVEAGHPAEEGVATTNVHCLTPETGTSTHYFFGATRDFSLDDIGFNTKYSEVRRTVFSTEDSPMIAAQQARMGESDFWALSPVLLRSDEGAVRVRRLMDGLLRSEQATI